MKMKLNCSYCGTTSAYKDERTHTAEGWRLTTNPQDRIISARCPACVLEAAQKRKAKCDTDRKCPHCGEALKVTIVSDDSHVERTETCGKCGVVDTRGATGAMNTPFGQWIRENVYGEPA